MIWNTFFLHSLLKHKAWWGETLCVPHHGENVSRLDYELQARNLYVAGTGQEMWAYACDICMKIVSGPEQETCKTRASRQRIITLKVFHRLHQCRSDGWGFCRSPLLLRARLFGTSVKPLEEVLWVSLQKEQPLRHIRLLREEWNWLSNLPSGKSSCSGTFSKIAR